MLLGWAGGVHQLTVARWGLPTAGLAGLGVQRVLLALATARRRGWQRGVEWVALLSTLCFLTEWCWPLASCHTYSESELYHNRKKGEASVGIRGVAKSLQHAGTRDGIVRSNAICGQDRAGVVVLGGCGECVNNRPCAGPGG